MESTKKYEDYAYVLDYLPRGRVGSERAPFKTEPIIQLIGEAYLTLLEASVRVDSSFELHERVYVGKDRSRDKITHVIGRVHYDDLTSAARSELPLILENIVTSHEERFIGFFNVARAITPRMHALELLPGIGKKYMWKILEEREKKPFASFKDLQERTNIPDPVKKVVKRIQEELSGESKYKMFIRQS